MKTRALLSVWAMAILMVSNACQPAEQEAGDETGTPPVAEKQPKTLTTHGHERTDEYFWLRDRDNPKTIDYLKAENAYAEAQMAPLQGLQDELFVEMKGRIKENDDTAPVRDGDYLYYSRYEKGKEYAIVCRRKHDAPESDEEIILDENELAEGLDYLNVRNWEVSNDGKTLAYAVDTTGGRVCTIYFKDLETGKAVGQPIGQTDSDIAWAADNKTVFYVKTDPQTVRSYQLYRRQMNQEGEGELVYEEKDETFYIYVQQTRSKEYLLLHCASTLTDEVHYLRADQPTGAFKAIEPRKRDRKYDVDHVGDKFYIRTNDRAQNFRLMEAPEGTPSYSNWKELIGHREGVLLVEATPFKDFLAVHERTDGLDKLRVIPSKGEQHYVAFDEPVYSMSISANRQTDTRTLRYAYNSLTTPRTYIDYDMGSKQKTLVKQDAVLGDFDSENYVSERVFATAEDGTPVPMSIVYRKDLDRSKPQPLYLYGYGSYGSTITPRFSRNRLSLLDRGVIYVIGHVRGGQMMGRQWYEDGKLFKKKNTFTDFVACGETLVERGYTTPELMVCGGGSAGGLLVGAVVNLRPELFKGAVANVPFVDVVTTMLDASIPLTTFEYDEWGNPAEKDAYDYMLSYSPYDNVKAQEYPHMLVTAGLNDSQVAYWEPAKWVARLRDRKTDSNRLLFFTDMEAGHGGTSGRFARLGRVAREYAFLLDLYGKAQPDNI